MGGIVPFCRVELFGIISYRAAGLPSGPETENDASPYITSIGGDINLVVPGVFVIYDSEAFSRQNKGLNVFESSLVSRQPGDQFFTDCLVCEG